jgi:hypothetical protein
MPAVGAGVSVREPGGCASLGELATLEPDHGALAVPAVDVSMEDDPGGPLTAEEIGDPDQPPPGGWPMMRCDACEDGWRAKVAALEAEATALAIRATAAEGERDGLRALLAERDAEVARLRAVGGPGGPGAGGR